VRQIYYRGVILKTIYQIWSVLKQIARGVCYLRGCRHCYWHEACNANGDAAIGSSGTGEMKKPIPPFVLVGQG